MTMHTENPALLRITRVNGRATRSRTTLRLEGRLTVASLAEFARACEPFLARPEALELDASGLIYVDEQAVLELRRALDLQVRITACSPFISELLRERRP